MSLSGRTRIVIAAAGLAGAGTLAAGSAAPADGGPQPVRTELRILRAAGAAHLRLRTDGDWVRDLVRHVPAQRRSAAAAAPPPEGRASEAPPAPGGGARGASCCCPTAPTPPGAARGTPRGAPWAHGTPVSTIAYGTPEGVMYQDGTAVPVPVDGPALERLAQEAGGRYYEAASGGELRRVCEDIGSSIGYRVERREIWGWFVAAGLLLSVAVSAGSLLWFSRVP
ncbi:hypothetical protein [Actinomadura keratinilytica]|uniref:Secreted protein n=1 Tax=Actinomadura keratinilytica TaxID=547461 RepID=A0ABP7ZAX7_9ACTN